MIFLQGCTSKVASIKQDRIKLDYSPLLLPSKRDFSAVAMSEKESAFMAWELYAYIKELENALGACVEMGSLRRNGE